MKSIVTYDTYYEKPKRIAETFSETLQESGFEVDIFQIDEA